MKLSDTIIKWYEENGRDLPWRKTSDPYKIWLSEIILQQTRIEQGRSYWERFVEQFPSINILAEASEEEVLKLWQGLGYYSRARNLHQAARSIVESSNGMFPNTYDGILKMKGVGKYTAAAIASFAYHLPYPVIDGNVYRVVARLYGIYTPIATPAAYKEFETLLIKKIDPKRPHLFNQAMMDFGATYCKPSGPDCERCIFCNDCYAHKNGKVDFLPVKGLIPKVKERFFYYFDITWEEGGKTMTLMHQRTGDDIWKGLYEYPLHESDKQLVPSEIETISLQMAKRFSAQPPLEMSIGPELKHQLTHRTIHATFIHMILENATLTDGEKETTMTLEERKSKPISRLIDKYLSQLFITNF